MPQFTIELDDKGDFVGALPSEIDAILKRTDVTAHGRGYQKAVEEAKPQIADGIKRGIEAEMAKINLELPLEREKFKQTSEENKALSTKLIEQSREHDKAIRTREERHAQELVDRAESLKKRDAKIINLVKASLQGEALKAGAREETLEDISILLESSIGYNDDMEPFVKDNDGRERLVHGKPVSIAAFVKEFLDSRPSYRKAPAGRGGGAPGGASFRQPGGSAPPDVAAARRRIEEGDRSDAAITAMFEASRKKSA